MPTSKYPQGVTIGKVSGELMNAGRTVKLDGVGTFYYTPNTQGQGVDTAEKVSAKQSDVRGIFEVNPVGLRLEKGTLVESHFLPNAK